jgi:hypothetical protein
MYQGDAMDIGILTYNLALVLTAINPMKICRGIIKLFGELILAEK